MVLITGLLGLLSCSSTQKIEDMAQRQRVLEERVISLEAEKIQKSDPGFQQTGFASKKDFDKVQGNFTVLSGETQQLREDLTYTINQTEVSANKTNELNQKMSLLEKRLGLLEIELEKLKSPGAQNVVIPTNTSSANEDALYHQAFKQYQDKDYPGAVRLFLEYRQQYPRGKFIDRTYYFIGGANFRNSKNQEAANELEQLLQLYPKSEKYNDGKFLLAVTYERLNDKKNALKLYDELIKSPDSSYKLRAEERVKIINSTSN